MKILKSWLNDYVSVNDITNSDLDTKITFSGIEVEDIEQAIDDLVIVAEIKEIKPHPDADRLRLATVFDGQKESEIVCGAPNIEVGQKVPLAQIGAVLRGEFEIKEAIIRGVKSSGMLCAADELGTGTDHSGILILPAESKSGQRVSEVIDTDTIFDLKPTPNRGDCFSHLGIAREVAAVTDQQIKLDEMTLGASGETDLAISIENKEDCTSYFGAVIKGVKIAESPDWLKNRLIAVGAKPINNIVDITNYTMLDLGQPLHAFDAAKIADRHITVRRAKADETITTLDGISRKLSSSNLLITDNEKAIAIAGVMGGNNSEITTATTDIVLESAQFTPSVVRKSAKILNLSTEASYRFERGVDPLLAEKSLAKAAKMIVDLAGGEILGVAKNIAKAHEPKTIKIPYNKINDLLGLSLSATEINGILTRLGFGVKHAASNNETMKQLSNDSLCLIPSWRRDISIWQDLAEEVGRIYGLNTIAPQDLPKMEVTTVSDYHKKEYVKDLLVERGFSEVSNYSIISAEDAKVANLDTENLLEIANPVQPENKFMRNSLIPGLLKTIAKNPTFDPILIFEVGNVFGKDLELTNLALATSGKGAKETLIQAVESVKRDLEIKRTIKIHELTRDKLGRYKIRKPITYYVELNAFDLINEANFAGKDLTLKVLDKPVHYRPLSKFPAVTRDLAFIVDVATETSAIENDIYDQSELINRVDLFDEFTSDKFGQGKKNVAFHLYLQHPERTLTDEEANQVIEITVKSIENKFSAKLRD